MFGPARQLVQLLIDGQDAFLDEARDVLRTGLDTAPWITVDDTGARHKAKNSVCTQIGNDRFTSFSTTGSKSRLNFLEPLNAGDTTHLINDAGLAYMRERSLSGKVIDLLTAHPTKSFADRPAWTARKPSASPRSTCIPIRFASPPRARCGARSQRRVCCAAR
jgi:hypothetical protein